MSFNIHDMFELRQYRIANCRRVIPSRKNRIEFEWGSKLLGTSSKLLGDTSEDWVILGILLLKQCNQCGKKMLKLAENQFLENPISTLCTFDHLYGFDKSVSNTHLEKQSFYDTYCYSLGDSCM